jgi:hypothetical protein
MGSQVCLGQLVSLRRAWDTLSQPVEPKATLLSAAGAGLKLINIGVPIHVAR